MRVRELAEWLGATFEGDGEKELTGVAPLETAGGSELSFLGGRKAAQQADSSAAGWSFSFRNCSSSEGRGRQTMLRKAALSGCGANSTTRSWFTTHRIKAISRSSTNWAFSMPAGSTRSSTDRKSVV